MSSPFLRKLKREVQRSPQKAAALGVLLLIAIWFWAPLLIGSSTSSEPAQPQPEEQAATPSSGSPAATSEPGPEHAWQDLAAAISADEKMKPAASLVADINPFHAPAPVEKVEETTAVAVAPPPEVTPAMAGLVLTSTIIGRATNVAVIGGRTYRVGDEIAVATKDAANITFVVAEVQARAVVLVRGVHRYELRLPSPLIDETDRVGLTSADGSPSAGSATHLSN